MKTKKTVPIQVRVRPAFYSSIKAAASALNISACAFVRLSVATQIKNVNKETFAAAAAGMK